MATTPEYLALLFQLVPTEDTEWFLKTEGDVLPVSFYVWVDHVLALPDSSPTTTATQPPFNPPYP
jgi:hypothetical protein